MQLYYSDIVRINLASAAYPVISTYHTTQLNSTQLTTPKEEWINKRKEAKKLLYTIYPRFFSKQSRCFLKVAIVSQLIKDIGKLFHMSIILTVKKIS